MIAILAACAVGAALGVFGCLAFAWRSAVRGSRSTRRKGSENTGRTSREREKRKQETMKRVIWVCLTNGFLWVWCSYLLAYLDKPQIAEALSQVAVTEIIGVVLAYAIKSAVENLSKNNRWPDKGDPPESEDGAG